MKQQVTAKDIVLIIFIVIGMWLMAYSVAAFAGGSKPVLKNPPFGSTPIRIDEPTPTPLPMKPVPQPQVDKGWLPEYTFFVEHTVEKLPALLDLPASRMQGFCRGWADMNKAQRRRFFSSLMYAIAGPESSYNRLAMYWEKGQGTDSVTGARKFSEGLLQLSYSDPKNYHRHDSRSYGFCPFNFERDRAAFTMDDESYERKRQGSPSRTILNAYNNLQCGVFITHHLMFTRAASKNADFQTAMGAYWSVMRKTSKSHARVVRELVKLEPQCK